MTKHKTFKRRVRGRMEKTGESYTAARRMLLHDDAPEGEPKAVASSEEAVSADAVAAATGRPREDWFALLDAWDATTRSHTETARWLREEHDVAGWWAQNVTVAYEQARGLRAPGQRASGWSVSATRTIAVPADRLLAAFTDAATRDRWLPGAPLRPRRTTAKLTARYDWEDGPSRVLVTVDALAGGRSRIAVTHERLPDADGAAAMKAHWRKALSTLKELLEG